MTIIAVDQLTGCYDQRIGVVHITLDIPVGSILGFLTPMGKERWHAISAI